MLTGLDPDRIARLDPREFATVVQLTDQLHRQDRR